MMKRNFLYFDEGDDLEAELVNVFLTLGSVAEILPRSEATKGEL
jgi:hypothetical protein